MRRVFALLGVLALAGCSSGPMSSGSDDPPDDKIEVTGPCTPWAGTGTPEPMPLTAVEDAEPWDGTELPGDRFRMPPYDPHSHAVPAGADYTVSVVDQYVVGWGTDAHIPWLRVRSDGNSWSARAEGASAADSVMVLVTDESLETGNLAALDVDTGAVLWCREHPNGFGDTVVVGDTVIASVFPYLAAFDVATGEERWTTPWTGDFPGYGGFLAADDSHIVAMGSDEQSVWFVVFDADGTRRGAYITALPGWVSDGDIVDDHLVVQTDHVRWFAVPLTDLPEPAPPEPSPALGDDVLAFTTRSNVSDQIVVMNTDGSGRSQLTWTGSNSSPAWSPDGSRIAFTSDRDGNREIYVMNADGSDQRRLTDHAGGDGEPTWSPDGSRLAFTGPGGLYVTNADGTGQTVIAPHPAAQPAWSPDGTSIVFTGGRADPGIFVVGADGTGLTKVAFGPYEDSSPAWSPDGSAIVYSQRDNNNAVVVMDADGSNQRLLTPNHDIYNGEPVWSPDGTQILFVSFRDGNAELYVMAADGSGQTNLTQDPLDDRGGAWSPDGSQIAFARGDIFDGALYVMNADGSGVTQIPGSEGGDHTPVWRPAP